MLTGTFDACRKVSTEGDMTMIKSNDDHAKYAYELGFNLFFSHGIAAQGIKGQSDPGYILGWNTAKAIAA